MVLNTINLRKSYNSDINDIVKDFYIPILSNSIKYQRLAGFFSSSSLAVAARGISNFINNDGHMELVCSAKFNKYDIEAIKAAYKNPEEVIEEFMIAEMENLEEGIIKDHVAALGWMVANNRLKIKIAVLLDDEGIPIDETKGIFHQKIGILTDKNGNRLSFSGSINESAYGWKHNIEEIKIFKEWEDHENEYFLEDCKNFKKFWNGVANKIRIYDMPEAVNSSLIKIAPSNISDIKINSSYVSSVKEEPKINLWDHQNKAIENWVNNGMMGIFEMATGTGKTFTALGCLNNFFNKKKNKSISIIACPYSHLIDQWYEDLEEFGFKEDVIIANSANPSWKRELNNYIFDINTDISERLIVFTTHDTLSSNKFIEAMNESRADVFLIVDEVHGIGSNKRRNGLLNNYHYRLGLSATPTRWFDEHGTKIILDYFKDLVYSFPLEKALSTINPDTGEYYLTPYEYRPIFVNLESFELEEYILQTQKIAKSYYNTSNKEKRSEILTALLNKRQRIINNAKNKYKGLIEILEENKGIKYLLVYCSPQQIDKVQDILLELKITPQHKFTMNEGTKRESRYGGVSERDFLLKEFSKGHYRVLTAMKCLDEGVDVPSAKTAIIMASTSNPREYIQRRGRVLRRSPNKKRAVIYDLIVFPTMPKFGYLDEIEKKIMDKEIERFKEFARTAINSAECMEILQKFIYREGRN